MTSKWKKHRAAVARRRREVADRHLAPLTLSPWRMAIAKAAVWIVSRTVRILLRVMTFFARATVVRKGTPAS